MCLYNFRSVWRALSAGDVRGSWVWCLSRQQASLEALGGCGEAGLARPGGRELDLSL